MKKVIKIIFSVRMELQILLLLAITTYFLIELVLNNYRELFSGAHYLGVFFSNISIAYVSAYIFYFFVVHIKEFRDRENVNEFIGFELHSIITSAHLLIQPFMQLTDKKATFQYLSKDELSTLLSSVNRFNNEAPYSINGNNANWIMWYDHLKETTKKSLREIISHHSQIESGLLKILKRIEHSLFFKQFDLLYNPEVNKSFSIYLFQIYSYLNHIKDLENYMEKNLKIKPYAKGEFIGAKDFFKN